MRKLITTLCLSFAVLLGSIGSSSALPPCPTSDGWHNCFGVFADGHGNKYVGEWKDNKRHGHGTKTYANGRIKEGVWENDKYVPSASKYRKLKKKREKAERDRIYEERLTKCRFDNVDKVTNEYTRKIVEEECRRRIK
jgi:hypothetical protein